MALLSVCFFFLVALESSSASTIANASNSCDVEIALNGTKSPFPHFWKRCFGSGHALLATRADWQEHLQRARNELGLAGVRMHGILDDDMSVAPSPGDFRFYNVDRVMDFLSSVGVKPIVELSFMPSSLARCSAADCRYAFGDRGGYKGLTMPPADPNEWHDLVAALAHHLVERYGLAEVASWRFEVWNEMWGIPYGSGPGQYIELYNASATAIKGVHSSLRVGGPSSAGLENVADLLRDTGNGTVIPLDFVSTHHYPSDPSCTRAGTHSTDPDCFVKDVLDSAALAHGAGLPFILSEYKDGLQGGPGTGYGGQHGDTAYASAFILHTVPLLSSIEELSWWTFSDIFEENSMDGRPFYGGFGLLTSQGVPKPAWRAFELLAGAGALQLSDVIVSDPTPAWNTSSTVSVLGTLGEDLQIFLTNFGPQAGASAVPWTTPENRTVRLQLKGADSTQRAALRRGALLRRIDDENTAPFAAWNSMGSPDSLTEEQLATLHAASEMPVEAVAFVESDQGIFLLDVELPAYGVAHLTVSL